MDQDGSPDRGVRQAEGVLAEERPVTDLGLALAGTTGLLGPRACEIMH